MLSQIQNDKVYLVHFCFLLLPLFGITIHLHVYNHDCRAADVGRGAVQGGGVDDLVGRVELVGFADFVMT